MIPLGPPVKPISPGGKSVLRLHTQQAEGSSKSAPEVGKSNEVRQRLPAAGLHTPRDQVLVFVRLLPGVQVS